MEQEKVTHWKKHWKIIIFAYGKEMRKVLKN